MSEPKKLTVDEMTRLAFVYAEQDRIGLLDAYSGCDSAEDVQFKAELRALIKQMREYRVKRWGKTQFEQITEGAKAVDALTLKAK